MCHTSIAGLITPMMPAGSAATGWRRIKPSQRGPCRPFWRRRGERVIGVIALILSIAVFLPIPLGNWLPAFATALVGLALSERDGVLFAVGCVVGVTSLAVIAVVVASAGAVLTLLWETAGMHHWW